MFVNLTSALILQRRYVTENSTTDPFVGWLIDVANTTNPPLVNSMSWGSIEQVGAVSALWLFVRCV